MKRRSFIVKLLGGIAAVPVMVAATKATTAEARLVVGVDLAREGTRDCTVVAHLHDSIIVECATNGHAQALAREIDAMHDRYQHALLSGQPMYLKNPGVRRGGFVLLDVLEVESLKVGNKA